jgi:hypothetical protein
MPGTSLANSSILGRLNAKAEPPGFFSAVALPLLSKRSRFSVLAETVQNWAGSLAMFWQSARAFGVGVINNSMLISHPEHETL